MSSSSGPFSRFGVEPGVMEGVPPRGVVVGVVAVRLGRPWVIEYRTLKQNIQLESDRQTEKEDTERRV